MLTLRRFFVKSIWTIFSHKPSPHSALRIRLTPLLLIIAILFTSLMASPSQAAAAFRFQTVSNDDISGAVSFNTLPFAITPFNTAQATTATDDPVLPCAVGAPEQQSNTVWYHYQAAQAETVVVDTMSSAYNTVLAVWTGSRGALSPVACNDDANGWNTSTLSFAAVSGQQYYIEVAQAGAPGGGALTLRARSINAVHPITRQSVKADGSQVSSGGTNPTISRDGRYIAFSSNSNDLVSGGGNGKYQVYLRDLQTGLISLVGLDGSGIQINRDNRSSSISGDGRYVVFASSIYDSVNSKNDTDVFLRDTISGTTTLVTVDESGVSFDGFDPVISADGKYVSFSSSAKLASDDLNGKSDIFLYNVQTREIKRISLSSTQNDANSDSYYPAISADGRYVAFISTASNLVAVGTNGKRHIFLRDTQANTTTLISVSDTEVQANDNNYFPAISDDGRYVAFESVASNLSSGPLSNPEGVYIRDTQGQNGGTTTRIDVNMSEYTNWFIDAVSISGDGKSVIYTYEYENVYGNYQGRLLRYDALTYKTEPINLAPSGLDFPRDYNVESYYSLISLSTDGRLVAFSTEADDLVANDTNGTDDVFLLDLNEPHVYSADQRAGASPLDAAHYQYRMDVRAASAAPEDPAYTCNGIPGSQASSVWFRYQPGVNTQVNVNTLGSDYNTVLSLWKDSAGVLTFEGCDDDIAETGFVQSSLRKTVTAGQTYYIEVAQKGSSAGGWLKIFLSESIGGQTTVITNGVNGQLPNDYSDEPNVSADGRYVVFESAATNLVSPATSPGNTQIYLYDQFTSQKELISISSAEVEGNGDSYYPAVSANGRFVVFQSNATNLVDGDTNAQTDIFVRDRQVGETTRVSVSSYGEAGNNYSNSAKISADGRYILFVSDASNLVPNDVNNVTDVFVHDRQTGATSRVSVSSDGTQANSSSYQADISADGRFIVFQSYATNLIPNDLSNQGGIYVHDRATGQTMRVDVSSSGQVSNNYSSYPAISANGRYIAFESRATNLVVGDTNNEDDIFVHDRITGTTTRVNLTSDGAQSNDGSSGELSLSADGRYITFLSDGSNLVSGDGNDWEDLFVHDRQSHATSLVDISSYGNIARNGAYAGKISADGRYAAFSAYDSGLIPDHALLDTEIFVHEMQPEIQPSPWNDTFAQAATVAELPFLDFRNTTQATTDASDPVFDCGSAAQSWPNTVWYQFTPQTSGNVAIDTQLGTDYPALVSLWTGSENSLTRMGCKAYSTTSGQPKLNAYVTAGQTYYILAAQSQGTSGGLLALRIEESQGLTASRLEITAPANIDPSLPVQFLVTAYDETDQKVTSYNGTVTFTSTDARAVLPGNDAFVPGSGEYHTSAIFETPGSQTLTVTDINNPSLTDQITITVSDTLNIKTGDVYYADQVSFNLNASVPAGTTSLPIAASSGLYPQDEVLLLTMTGPNRGVYETAVIASVEPGSITLSAPLAHDYAGTTGKVVVQRVPHYGNVIVASGGLITAHAWDSQKGGVVFLHAGNITVESGGKISASEQGYINLGEQAGFAAASGSGGGYGGYGGGSQGGKPYGSVISPNLLGSCGVANVLCDGKGGGIVWLVANGTFTNNGQIDVNGEKSHNSGSGGSLWLEAGIFQGSGVLQARGGDSYDSSDGSGGGGGRIAITFASNQYTGGIEPFGGAGRFLGGPGTVFFKDSQNNTAHLKVDNQDRISPAAGLTHLGQAPESFTFDQIELVRGGNLEIVDSNDSVALTESNMKGDETAQLIFHGILDFPFAQTYGFGLYVPQGSTLNLPANFTVRGKGLTNEGTLGMLPGVTATNLTVAAGSQKPSTLRLAAMGQSAGQVAGTYAFGQVMVDANQLFELAGDPTRGQGVELHASSMTIAGHLSADGLGYTTAQNGPGGSTSLSCGASHGGKGGGTCSPEVYGSLEQPVTLGSAGAIYYSSGPSGGGAIHLLVEGELSIPSDGTFNPDGSNTGTISANGAQGFSSASGGSVWLSAGAITGNGYVRAKGGGTTYSSYGGGGGRIAVDTSQLADTIHFDYSGGLAYTASQYGANGTYFSSLIDLQNSTVEASPTNLRVNEMSTLTITVLNTTGSVVANVPVGIEVADGEAIIINGQTVSRADGFYAIGVTNDQGKVSVQFTAHKSGARTIRARARYDTLAQTETVTFTPGDLAIGRSGIYAATDTGTANGSDTINVYAVARDMYDNPVENVSVEFRQNADSHAQMSPLTVQTDAQGRANTYLFDSTAETVAVSAYLNGSYVGAKGVTFSGLDLSLFLYGSAKVPAGGTGNYEARIRNTTTFNAENVALTLTLPEGVQLSSYAFGAAPAQNGSQYVWSFGTLTGQQDIIFRFTLLFDQTIQPGTALNIAAAVSTTSTDPNTENNQASVTTTVTENYKFAASMTPQDATLRLGGKVDYEITITNSGSSPDSYTLSLSGLDSSWFTLEKTQVALQPGGQENITLTVQPAGCPAQTALPFTVSVASNGSRQTTNLAANLALNQAPQISMDAPWNGAVVGSRTQMIIWRSNPATSGTMYIYPSGSPELAQSFPFSRGTSQAVQVENLTRNTGYRWYIEAASTCGSITTGPQSFTVGNGLVFVNRQQSIEIERNYNQRVKIAIRNDDSLSHTLTANVLNPYEDLIVNFVDSGSSDQTVNLNPGETREIDLAFHAQDTKLQDYQLTAHLVADKDTSAPIEDNALLKLHVLQNNDYTIVEDTAAYDPLYLGKTYVVTNNGTAITDFSVAAMDPTTEKPAQVFVKPSINHARLDHGQQLRFTVYPIFTAANVSSTQATANSGAHLAAVQAQASGVIDYQLITQAADRIIKTLGNAVCGGGRQVYPVTVHNKIMTCSASDWYCTNRPYIRVPLSTPPNILPEDIAKAWLNVTFTPHSNVQDHDGQILMNGTQIGGFSDTIPNGTFTFDVPPSLFNTSVAGPALQTITLTTQHPNSGHYISSSEFALSAWVSNAAFYVCAPSQEAANTMIPPMCSIKDPFNPWEDVYDGSALNWGEIKKLIQTVAADNGYQISATSCTQGDCGDPINTRTGVFSFASPDISFPTTAGDLVFQRAYSSGTTASYTKLLGYGWTHNHDAQLIFPADPGGLEGFVLFKDVLGNQYLFAIQQDGTYKPGPGVLADLTKSTETPVTYTLTTPEQAKFTFNESGKVLSRANAQGHSFDYSYNAQGKLARISADQGSRYLDLAYDDQGRIISVTDYSGRQVTYTYDTAGNLATSKDLLGNVWQYSYDLKHHMTQVVDPSAKETVTTEYDLNGRAAQQWDGEGKLMVRIVYNSDGTTTVYDAQGNAKTHQYNAHKEATQQRDELNRATDTTFDANFRPTTITNAAGHTLTMEWSADGKNMLAKTDPAGNRTEYTYDALNNLLSEKDPLGNVTQFTYTGKLITSRTDASGNTTTYTYTSEGYLATETDSFGQTTTYTYDAHGQRTSITDSYSRVTTYKYDALGRLTDTTDPHGRVTHNEYNAAGQMLKATVNYDPTRPQNDENQYNIVTSYAYDARGNQVSTTDSLGRVTRSEYDDAGHLVRSIDAAGNATTNTYDDEGRLLTTTDALGRTTTYVYDAVGRRLTTIDALGQSSGMTTFDIAANTSTATDALGRSATYYYNTLNQTVKVVDPLGNATTTTYDANGSVETRTDQLGRMTRYEYDALNRLVKNTDPTGAVTETIYNAKGQRTATIDALGHRTEYTYDAQGRLIDTLDVMGRHSTNEYDDHGNLITVTDPQGHITRTEYDQWDRRTATVDAAGRRTTYIYDALDRVISTTDPTGTSTTTYDALGNVTARTDVHGRTSTITYDVLGRAITTTDFAGNTTNTEYDKVGNLLSTTDGQGNKTSYTYDALNRRVTTTDPLGNTTQVAYDVLGNVTDETDANGVVTHTLYDDLNRPVAVIQNYRPPLEPTANTNVRVDCSYNAVGNRTQVKDPNGHVTEFRYDPLNRVTAKIDPLGNTWQYTYNLAGRLTAQTDGNGKTTSYTYDAAGNLTLIDYPAPDPDVSFTYNAAGQQLTMTDGQGTTTWTYDALGRMTSVTHPDGSKVAYTYNVFGSRQTMTTHIDAADVTGKTVTYAYDADQRVISLTDWQAHATHYTYDAAGRVQTVQPPNGVTSSYSYDKAGRLTDLTHTQGTVTLAAYHYSYDPAGNRVGATETVLASSPTPPAQLTALEQGYMAITLAWPDSNIEETGYHLERSTDGQHWQPTADLPANTLRYVNSGLALDTIYWYRLTPYNSQGDGPAQTVQTQTGMQPVTYPVATQRTLAITYTYDALKRLAAAVYDDGTAFRYTYDAAGNTLQLAETIAGQTRTTAYTYDIANQLVTAQEGSETAWQYHYDANGSLAETTPGAQAGEGARRYHYNTAGQLTQVETHDGTAYQPQAEMEYDGQGQRLSLTAHQGAQSLTSHYLLEGDQPLAVTAAGQTTYYLSGIGEYQADWRYYLPDGTGSVRQVTDGQGRVTLARSFTPWGEVLAQSGQSDITSGYLGGLLDVATGLIYLGNGQYYDPATGRFLTRGVKPTQTNPYVPWQGDPTGSMIAPLALLAMVYSRKKNRGKWDRLVIVLVLCVTLGMGLTACEKTTIQPTKDVTMTAAFTPEPNNPKNYQLTLTATTVKGTEEASFTLKPSSTATPPSCTSDPQHTINNARLVAARIYYEGASTYYKGTGAQNDPGVSLYKKMVFAVKSLHERFAPGSEYQEFTRYNNNAGRKLLSIADSDCNANPNYCRLADASTFNGSDLDSALPSYAEEMVNQVFTDDPCAPGNPFSAYPDNYKDGIHWLSPTVFPRLDVNTENHMLVMKGVKGCDSGKGCQHNDIRERPHFEQMSGGLKEFRLEELIGFTWDFSKTGLNAPRDANGNTECYWRGVYFFSESSFMDAQKRSQQPYPALDDYNKGSFICPTK